MYRVPCYYLKNKFINALFKNSNYNNSWDGPVFVVRLDLILEAYGIILHVRLFKSLEESNFKDYFVSFLSQAQGKVSMNANVSLIRFFLPKP